LLIAKMSSVLRRHVKMGIRSRLVIPAKAGIQ